MAIVYDVEASKLIEEVAKELAKDASVKMPDWAQFVKTGPSKERVPYRDDWWHVRASAILRAIYSSKGPIGVQKLRIKYGSKKNRGHKPERFYMASGKIIRLILQQLEAGSYLKQATIGVHKGRIIAPKGKSLLDKTASKISGIKPQKAKKVDAAIDKPKETKADKIQDKPKPADKPKKEKAEAKPKGKNVTEVEKNG